MARVIVSKKRFVRVDPYTPDNSFSDSDSHIGSYLIAQFEIPAAALEGVITSVRFHLDYKGQEVEQYNTSTGAVTAVRAFSAWETNSKISCYKTSNTTDLLTYNNYKSKGELSSPQSLGMAGKDTIVFSQTDYEPKYTEYANHSGTLNVDVTGLMAGNIENNIVGFVLSGAIKSGSESSGTNFTYIAGYFRNPTLEIVYEAPSAKTPSIVFPSDVYIKEGTQVNLSWLYNSNGSAVQQSAVVEYHDSTTNAWTAKTITGQSTNYTVPESFAQGLVTWRVKTTDSNGNTSEYASATFTIIGRPAMPVITSVDNAKLTTIRWNSEEQISYRLSLYKGDELIDEKEGSEDIRQYRPNFFLDNGTYTFMIAVSNAADMWSVDSSKVFTIDVTSSPAKPSIVLTPVENDGVRISVPSTTDTFYIVKNDVVIAKAVEDYTDYEVVPGVEYRYKIRAYDGTGYTDSDVRTYSADYTGFYLMADNIAINVETSTNEFIPLEEHLEREKAIISYSGRDLPVSELGEKRTRALTRQVTVKTLEELELLKALYEKAELIYRDTEGNCIHATISDISISRWKGFGWNVQMIIQQIDSEEVIINA